MCMFSGIIETVGEIKKIEDVGGDIFLTVFVGDLVSKVKVGDSVSNSGVCLTVIEINNQNIKFEVMQETIKKTTLSHKIIGDRLNIETSLKVGGEIGGHFVYGHVDGVGVVVEVNSVANDKEVVVDTPKEIMKYIVPQGSVALDGVSLTIADLYDNSFRVSLIEHTLKETTLGNLKVGDKLNVEADMLAKYVHKQISPFES